MSGWLPPRVVGDPPALSFTLEHAERQPDGTWRLPQPDHDFAWLFESVTAHATKRLRAPIPRPAGSAGQSQGEDR